MQNSSSSLVHHQGNKNEDVAIPHKEFAQPVPMNTFSNQKVNLKNICTPFVKGEKKGEEYLRLSFQIPYYEIC